MIHKLGCIATAMATLLVAAAAGAQDKPRVAEGKDAQVGRSFRVPYRLTDTNHFLVRVRINGKGPFNFLVDSGAPALYVATETAAKIGLKPPANGFWTPLDRLEIEGGARLEGVKARVEDPFQLVGMNALGLPGASIDGILGFTILAKFKLEIDPTQDRMTWTRLDFDPADPPVPHKDDGEQPAELQLMNALGPVAKGLAFLMGKQPEEVRVARGFLGLTWTEAEPGVVRVVRILADSPAAAAGVKPGDRLLKIGGKTVDGLKSARALLADVRPADPVAIVVQRAGGDKSTLTLTAGEGL
ncbi:MAG: PDZ domain-containing protein [Paludisphaera borealis]|uniref:PDZ domain-containing protein n=1 Tax=Paludisphaera borealis TaxID=1387353 RepID=UPI002847A1C1|nr:PDZ domain-containing protein [Paludisphaera borealis]MDR3619571.1 PDZ domain-containing protein [Paludisphaera borealis]